MNEIQRNVADTLTSLHVVVKSSTAAEGIEVIAVVEYWNKAQADKAAEEAKASLNETESIHIMSVPISRDLAASISYTYELDLVMQNSKQKIAEIAGVMVDSIDWSSDPAESILDAYYSEVYCNIFKYGCSEEWSYDEADRIFRSRIEESLSEKEQGSQNTGE